MDLNNLFQSSSVRTKTHNESTDLIVSDDEQLLNSIRELYAIEGYSAPIEVPDLESDESWNRSDVNLKHVILDMRGANRLVDDVSIIATRLDVSISLLVLADIDSIKLRNQIHAIGAIYVLWDPDLDGLLASLQPHQIDNLSTKKTRIAKRILILGTKGGIGVSCFSSVIANALATQTNLKTLLVDHDSGATNSDIFLGVKGLKPKQNSIDLNQIDIDSAIARTYVHRVEDKLDYLVLDKNSACLADHASTLFNLSSELVDQYNFIIDSAPFSVYEEIHDREFSDKYHRVFVVCEPSVSSLRSYNLLKKKMGKSEHQVVFILNRPVKDYMVTLSNAKERIRVKDTLDIMYEQNLEKTMIQEGIEGLMKSKYSNPVAEVVMNLTGKKIKTKSRFSLFKK
ncbi:AAA family ATPase [Vibrio sp. TRT 21S02]|uniref:AAA family ATPase n=1 Tax=Vibrio sp. TRT 21S02 TaxID=3418507 RepID=UPI003CE91F4B